MHASNRGVGVGWQTVPGGTATCRATAAAAVLAYSGCEGPDGETGKRSAMRGSNG